MLTIAILARNLPIRIDISNSPQKKTRYAIISIKE